MVATGIVGGFDVGLGITAEFVVIEATDSRVLGALAFTIGFVALTLARSELFTEDFLVPVTTVITHDRVGVPSLVRLWTTTLVANLAGGFVFMVLAVAALPAIGPLLVTQRRHVIDAGIGTEALASAALGGFAITLMTWMERGTDVLGGKLVAAVAASFVLAVGPLNHSVVGSLDMFGALVHGADFGYADWAGAFGWAVARQHRRRPRSGHGHPAGPGRQREDRHRAGPTQPGLAGRFSLSACGVAPAQRHSPRVPTDAARGGNQRTRAWRSATVIGNWVVRLASASWPPVPSEAVQEIDQVMVTVAS